MGSAHMLAPTGEMLFMTFYTKLASQCGSCFKCVDGYLSLNCVCLEILISEHILPETTIISTLSSHLLNRPHFLDLKQSSVRV